jgi:hypothetical protein
MPILIQFEGMCDALTNYLVRKTISMSPFVIKSVLEVFL